MQIGVGLPNTLMPQTDRTLMLDWARAAEAAGFSTLGTIDKPNYDSWEPLIALTAAAAVTERIRLATTILQLPCRNEVLVAKEAAAIDLLSGGRLDLGLAVGGREDDFTVLDASFHDRGRRFGAQLQRIRQIWSAARASTRERAVLGPAPVQQPGPPIWLGGITERTMRRAVRLGDGFIFAATGPGLMHQMTPAVRAWARDEGKAQFPIAGVGYAGIGDNAEEALNAAASQVFRYYGMFWRPKEEMIHHGPPAKIAEDLRKYADSGIDQIILFLEIPDVRQVELLARARELAGLG